MGTHYYLNGPLGSAFGLSFSRSAGVQNVRVRLDVMEYGKTTQKSLILNANPINLLNISYLRYWRMGQRNRFNIELGYSIQLSSPASNYTINTPNVVLAKKSADALSFIQPGGMIMAIGFSFSIAEQVVLKY